MEEADAEVIAVEATIDQNLKVEGPRLSNGKREVAIAEVTGVENSNTAEVIAVEATIDQNLKVEGPRLSHGKREVAIAEVTGVENIRNTAEDVDEVLMKKANTRPEAAEEVGDRPHPHLQDLSYSPATSSHWRNSPAPMHMSTM